MREMSTDRPDKTESPYTVDAGHFQVEMDVLAYSYDRNNGLPGDTRVESLSIAPMNLKVGLCNRADFQVFVETYNSVRTHVRATGQVERSVSILSHQAVHHVAAFVRRQATKIEQAHREP